MFTFQFRISIRPESLDFEPNGLKFEPESLKLELESRKFEPETAKFEPKASKFVPEAVKFVLRGESEYESGSVIVTRARIFDCPAISYYFIHDRTSDLARFVMWVGTRGAAQAPSVSIVRCSEPSLALTPLSLSITPPGLAAAARWITKVREVNGCSNDHMNQAYSVPMDSDKTNSQAQAQEKEASMRRTTLLLAVIACAGICGAIISVGCSNDGTDWQKASQHSDAIGPNPDGSPVLVTQLPTRRS